MSLRYANIFSLAEMLDTSGFRSTSQSSCRKSIIGGFFSGSATGTEPEAGAQSH